MDKEAQIFMNTNGIKECYECDGLLFKHKENADARAKTKSAEVKTHTLSAGAKPKKDKPE